MRRPLRYQFVASAYIGMHEPYRLQENRFAQLKTTNYRTDPFTRGAPLSLRSNITWNLTGNVVYAACQWGMVVVLAKMTTSEMLGKFALGLAVTAPIFLLSQLQLRGVQATDAQDDYGFGHYFGLRILTTTLAMTVVVVVALLGYNLQTAGVIIAVGLSKGFESISDVLYGLMQRHERMDRIALSRMIKGPLSLLAMGMLIRSTGNILWSTLSMAAVWGAILFGFDMPNGGAILRKGRDHPHSVWPKPIFDRKRLVALAKLALPLGLVSALTSLQPNIPRYFIEGYWGSGELGIFAALAYLIVVEGVIVMAVGQSAMPRLAQYYSAGEIDKYRLLLFRMLGTGLLLGAGGVLVAAFAGGPILKLLYRADYAERKTVLVWLMAGGGISYIASFLGCGILSARRFKIQLPIVASSVCAIIVASWLLVPRWGIQGGAMAIMIGNTVVAVLYAISMRSDLRGIFHGQTTARNVLPSTVERQ